MSDIVYTVVVTLAQHIEFFTGKRAHKAGVPMHKFDPPLLEPEGVPDRRALWQFTNLSQDEITWIQSEIASAAAVVRNNTTVLDNRPADWRFPD